MRSEVWNWTLGVIYIVAVAAIWIASSYVVQSVVDAGISPFLITYICNSLFVIYIPLVEAARLLEGYTGKLFFWQRKTDVRVQKLANLEQAILLEKSDLNEQSSSSCPAIYSEQEDKTFLNGCEVDEGPYNQLDAKGRWSRTSVAKVSLLICPFWFLAQLTFNLSLKYTTVTSNTILSTSSSLFTFLLSLAFLGEKFSWVKLIGVLLCMGGTIIVSFGDSEMGLREMNLNPILGDILSLCSAVLYAVYITLIRKKLPDDEKSGRVSMAQFLGFLGLFNLVIFLPLMFVLHFTKLESFTTLSLKQLGLIVGKGLLDNALSDYLWAKAVLLTTTTVATAGLTIQVPMAAAVDTLTGNAPNLTDYIGAAAVLVGFAGINFPSEVLSESEKAAMEFENEIPDDQNNLSVQSDASDL